MDFILPEKISNRFKQLHANYTQVQQEYINQLSQLANLYMESIEKELPKGATFNFDENFSKLIITLPNEQPMLTEQPNQLEPSN